MSLRQKPGQEAVGMGAACPQLLCLIGGNVGELTERGSGIFPAESL